MNVPVSYGYDATYLDVYTGYDSEGAAFINEVKAAVAVYDGKVTTDEAIISAVDPVVARYQGKHLDGTFAIVKWVDNSQIPEVVKNYTITGIDL